jgi:hypothetical protein
VSIRRFDEPVSAVPPATVCVVIENLFGRGAEETDRSEPDLSFAFGFVFTAVGSDVLDEAEFALCAACLAPALPGVVEEISPPELSEFITAGAGADAPDSLEVTDSDPAAEPLAASGEPVVDDPVVPEVVVVDVPDVSEVPVPDDVSVAPVSGPAHATPGALTTATPTPKATAKPPTRPTYVAYPITIPPGADA